MKKSKYAVASITLGILSFIQILGIEKALAAGIFGILALQEIKNDPSLGGKKSARAGIILGAVYIAAVTVLFAVKGGRIISIMSSAAK